MLAKTEARSSRSDKVTLADSERDYQELKQQLGLGDRLPLEVLDRIRSAAAERADVCLSNSPDKRRSAVRSKGTDAPVGTQALPHAIDDLSLKLGSG